MARRKIVSEIHLIGIHDRRTGRRGLGHAKVYIFECVRAAEQSAIMREHGLFLKFSGAISREVYIFLEPRRDPKKREWVSRRSTQFLRG